MTTNEAKEIDDILRRTANDLASLLDAKSFKDFPQHVEIGVRSEMIRLRRLAESIRPFTILPRLESALPE